LKQLAVYAVSLLKQSQVIAIPTDTIYGIAALVQDKTAVDKIYNIKGMKNRQPLSKLLSILGVGNLSLNDAKSQNVQNESFLLSF